MSSLRHRLCKKTLQSLTSRSARSVSSEVKRRLRIKENDRAQRMPLDMIDNDVASLKLDGDRGAIDLWSSIFIRAREKVRSLGAGALVPSHVLSVV